MVARIQSGDQQAFGEMYDNYSQALFGVLYQIFKDDEIAEDVLQESFVKIWRFRNSYSTQKGAWFTWMLNISRNTAIDKLRKMKSRGLGKNQSLEQTVNMGKNNAVEQNTDVLDMQDHVSNLSSELKEVLDCVYFQGHTHQEASEKLVLPLGTVKTRIRKALLELRKIYIREEEK